MEHSVKDIPKGKRVLNISEICDQLAFIMESQENDPWRTEQENKAVQE
ncbi:MAG: hypothetical protein ACLQGU_15150 [bacterium]